MAVSTINFHTGPSTLPDTGVLSYNGCIFSPLFYTSVSGAMVKDNANRTIKYMKYVLSADGYVTLPAGAASVNGVMGVLKELLTKQAGTLVYQGRGFDLVINPAGPGGRKDAAWGPIPELLEFQPLGGGKSAKVQWKVTVCVPEVPLSTSTDFRTDPRGRITAGRVLQFNYETGVDYAEDGYSSLSIRGTLEVPMTRTPTQTTRTLTYSADSFRQYIEAQIGAGIDLSRFRITHRKFDVSRDKRTLEWEFVAEEKPYMDMPPDCSIARGTYNVRPAKAGMGLVEWLCTLRATYVVRGDRPRRVAWLAFLALLRLRMAESRLGNVPLVQGGLQNPPSYVPSPIPGPVGPIYDALRGAGRFWSDTMKNRNRLTSESRNAWLIDFSFDEGLNLDSKTISFSATWRMITTFSHILIASGLWKKLPEDHSAAGSVIGGGALVGLGRGGNIWATSMRDVSGSQSWMPNRLDPSLDIIVDFGGP